MFFKMLQTMFSTIVAIFPGITSSNFPRPVLQGKIAWSPPASLQAIFPGQSCQGKLLEVPRHHFRQFSPASLAGENCLKSPSITSGNSPRPVLPGRIAWSPPASLQAIFPSQSCRGKLPEVPRHHIYIVIIYSLFTLLLFISCVLITTQTRRSDFNFQNQRSNFINLNQHLFNFRFEYFRGACKIIVRNAGNSNFRNAGNYNFPKVCQSYV